MAAPKRLPVKQTKWLPPDSNNLLFNVDGSVRGIQGNAGIGGVLRDHRGKVHCTFYSYVGLQDAITSELLAVEKACLLLAENPELVGRHVDIASDCQVAVDWINSRSSGSIRHAQTIQNICSSLVICVKTKVIKCNRSSNQFADSLAKKGAAGGEEVLWHS